LAASDFGWWRAAAVKSTAAQMDAGVGLGAKRNKGWQRTRDAIVSVFVRQGPCDGVLGFNRGCFAWRARSFSTAQRSAPRRFDNLRSSSGREATWKKM
jgi:hypothetical protein